MPTVEASINSFLRHRRLRNVAPSSLALYERWLTLWHAWRAEQRCGPAISDVTLSELRDYFLYLTDERIPHATNPRRPATRRRGLAPASVDTAWRVTRSFWRFVEKDGLLSEAQRHFFTDDRLPRPKLAIEVRPTYATTVIEQLLHACDDAHTEEGARDRAIVLLLAESGMRVSEVCALHDDQVVIEARRALIRGKGSKQRYVFWSPRAAWALSRYLDLRAGKPGFVFRSVGSRSKGQRLTTDAIRALLRRLASRAGVTLPPGAPVHALRHSFAHRAIEAGLDVSQVQQLMGHADIQTTMIYLRENAERLQDLHDRIFDTDRDVETRRRRR